LQSLRVICCAGKWKNITKLGDKLLLGAFGYNVFWQCRQQLSAVGATVKRAPRPRVIDGQGRDIELCFQGLSGALLTLITFCMRITRATILAR
jgi:hypothetical protein